MRWFATTVALVLVLFGVTNTAIAAAPEPRIALVIGNSAYEESPLSNPANDARLTAETLPPPNTLPTPSATPWKCHWKSSVPA